MQAEAERVKDSRWGARVARWWHSIPWSQRAAIEQVVIPVPVVKSHTPSVSGPNRWQCGGCTKITTSSGLTNHQKVSGHMGRTNLNEAPVNITRRASEAVVKSALELNRE